MTEIVFLIEKLTADETDYSVVGMTTDFETAKALAQRTNNCNISEWEYCDRFKRYRYVHSFTSEGRPIKC